VKSLLWILVLLLWACDDGPGPVLADASVDGSAQDGSTQDGSAQDAARPDAGPDAALPDAARPDASPTDAAPQDAGLPDAALDAEAPDAGPDAALDAEVDATLPDAEIDAEIDAAIPDAEVDAAPPPQPAPRISEVMARNSQTLNDDDGRSSDWIELYNPGPEPYDLTGLTLSDDPDEPALWALPELQLPGHGFLLIWASGLDRRDPAQPLHANFRLSGDGEVLLLSDANGGELDRFAFPAQFRDIAFGRPMRTEQVPLFSTGERLRHRPAPAEDDGWTAPDYDDAGWAHGRAGLGWDRAEAPRPLLRLADSEADFSGTQGEAGWQYGYWNASDDDDGAYAPADFLPFAAEFWINGAWDWPDGNPPWTQLGRTGGHPNATPNGPLHWAIRRWTSPIEGTVRIEGSLANPSAEGDGVVGRIFVDGMQVFEAAVDGQTVPVSIDVPVLEGSIIDWAIDPGPAHDDTGDNSVFTAQVDRPGTEGDARGVQLADSVAQWTADGTQGAHGWWAGYLDRSADLDAPYDPNAVALFGPEFWTGSAWDWPAGNPPWTLVSRDLVHPNGRNNGPEHWAVRRWIAEAPGPIVVEWHIGKINPGGTGLTGHVFHEGREVDQLAVTGGDVVGMTRILVLEVAVGDRVDFAVDPMGPGGNPTDGTDHADLRVRLWSVADLTPWIETQLFGGDRRVFDARLTVQVPQPAAGTPPLDQLVLSVRFDDGLQAWFDGAPVAEVNAPEPTDRPANAAIAPVRFPLLDAEPGAHVLALRGFDAPQDAQFLLAPEVFGLRLAMDDAPTYLPRPTPGAPNDPGDAGPLVFDVVAVPGAAPAVGVSIEVLAEVVPGGAPLDAVTLTYQVMWDDPQALEMRPFADGWRATIPPDAGAAGQMIRWRVEATDEAGLSGRAPAFRDPLDSEAWHGTMRRPGFESPLPVMHFFVPNMAQAGTNGGTRGALYYDGALYDNIRLDIHGQSTRGFPKKSHDVDFNGDHRFVWRADMPTWKDLNLLTNWADKSRMRNTLGYEVFRDAGVAYHLAEPVRLQLNGAFYAVYDLVEDGDDRWLERLGYGDPPGALYKMYDGMFSASRGEKKTRQDENKDDLRALIAGLGLDAAARRAFLFDNLDLPRMANYLAASVITSGKDCCHKNYYAYRDTDGTGEWSYLPWDVDLGFGRNWTGNYFDDRMYPNNGLFLARDLGGNNQLLRALYQIPEFVEMYLRRTRTLMDEQVQPPGTPLAARHFEARVAHWQPKLAAAMALDDAAWPTWGEPQPFPVGVERMADEYLEPRRAFLYGLVGGDAVEPLIDPTPGAVQATWRVPGPDTGDDGWQAPDFDDALWPSAPQGLGYENSPGDYQGLIQSQIRPADEVPEATTLQARYRFTVDDPAAAERLLLRLKFDDGVAVWLNGAEVVRSNVPPQLPYNAQTNDRSDDLGRTFEDHALDLALLQPGENVLTAQVTNTRIGSSDLLLLVGLYDQAPGGDGPLPLAQVADPEITLEAGALEPAHEAYVVLRNPTPDAVDLSRWQLSGLGITHTLVPGTVIPANGTLFVVADARGFRARAESPTGGESHFVQGNWSGVLDLEAPALELTPAAP
jgi:hypothetical protein